MKKLAVLGVVVLAVSLVSVVSANAVVAEGFTAGVGGGGGKPPIMKLDQGTMDKILKELLQQHIPPFVMDSGAVINICSPNINKSLPVSAGDKWSALKPLVDPEGPMVLTAATKDKLDKGVSPYVTLTGTLKNGKVFSATCAIDPNKSVAGTLANLMDLGKGAIAKGSEASRMFSDFVGATGSKILFVHIDTYNSEIFRELSKILKQYPRAIY